VPAISPPPAGPVLAYALGDALYLNITSACTLACVFCPKIRDGAWEVAGYDLKLERAPSADEVWEQVRAAGFAGRSEVVFTGVGAPPRPLAARRVGAPRLAAGGARRIRVDTDGLANLREGRDVTPEIAAAGVDALCVSLNATDAETYARLCPSRHGAEAYGAVRDFVRCALRCIPEVQVSFVGVPGLSEEECRRAAESLGAAFRWRPYDRVGRLRELGGNA
jgi:TatD DNase family protein